MSIIGLKTLLEEKDVLGFIAIGSDYDVYDTTAEIIFPRLAKDLSIKQIQRIVWNALYITNCVCSTVDGKEWLLDEKQAAYVLGDEDRYKDIAIDIRVQILGI